MLFFSEWSKPTVKGTEKEIDEKNGLKLSKTRYKRIGFRKVMHLMKE